MPQDRKKQFIVTSRNPLTEIKRASMFAFFLAGFTGILLASSLLSAGTPLGKASFSQSWIGPDGTPLPFATETEVLDFLRTAEVVHIENIPHGVTKPRRVLLEQGEVRAYACFRDVDISRDFWIDPNRGPRHNFRDYCVYECAAYKLSRLLGLRNIPPAVRRTIKGQKGTLQLWVENAQTEGDRLRSELKPPNNWRWAMQWQLMYLFDQLVYNDDRNQGNILFDPNWNIWMIDHTRCFRTFSDLPAPQLIRFCEKGVWESLKNLDEQSVKEKLKDYLRSGEIEALLKRREKLIRHIQGLIDERGEKGVLFTFYRLHEGFPQTFGQ